MSEDDERETRYIAVDGAEFDKLIVATQNLMTQLPQDEQNLLARWLSLRLAMTVIAITKGSTMDSQAQITMLLKTIESLQNTLERYETRHVDFFGPDGQKVHPDWCQECRVDRLVYSIEQALAELQRHIDGPETPPALANVCRRVARLLTSYKGWHAPVQWENDGLREVRALVEKHVKLNSVDDRYPWVSTIEGLNVLLGDHHSMRKVIERRGRWLAEARERLSLATGAPVTNRSLDGTGTMLERGAVLSVEEDGVTTLYTITDVQPREGDELGSLVVTLKRVD